MRKHSAYRPKDRVPTQPQYSVGLTVAQRIQELEQHRNRAGSWPQEKSRHATRTLTTPNTPELSRSTPDSGVDTNSGIITESYTFQVEPGKTAMIPKIRFSPEILSTGDTVFNVTFPMRLITGEVHEFTILLPPSRINPDINFDEIQKQALARTREDGTYADDRAFSGLKKTGTAFLVATTYPTLDATTQRALTIHMNNLFGTDDYADAEVGVTQQLVRESTENIKLLIIHLQEKAKDGLAPDQLYGELAKMKQLGGYSNHAIAYGRAYIDQIQIFAKKSASPDWCFETLASYFSSVGVEKGFEEDHSLHLTEEINKRIRADASGAVHAEDLGIAAGGVHLTRLEKDYYELIQMKISSSNCVEFSNDGYSLLKEHFVLLEKILRSEKVPEPTIKAIIADIKLHGLKDPVLIEKLRKEVAFNLPHIEWKKPSSKSLASSIQIALDKHNGHMTDYYTLKSGLEKRLETQKKSLRAKLTQETTLETAEKTKARVALEKLEADHLKIRECYATFEGWLAHGWWAVSVPRYNLGITECSQERLMELQLKQQRCLGQSDA